MSTLNEDLKALNINLQEVIDNAVSKTEELLKLDLINEAEILAKQLLVVDPENQHGLQLYGLILYRRKKYLESIEIQKKAISLDFDNAENHNNIALSYLHSGNIESAITEIETSLYFTPNDPNRLNNAGLIYRAYGDNNKALSYFKRAIDIDPLDSKGWENMGSLYGSLKQLDDAISCFTKAIELNESNLAAHVDLAYAYHLKGEWEKAWKEHEYRIEYWHSVGRNPGKFYDIYPPVKAITKCDDFSNKKIVVYCEQGNGDFIQFVRFVPDLIYKTGAEVYLDCPNELKSLFQDICKIKSPNQEYDYHCSVLSLPYITGNISAKDFKSDKPYFKVEKLDVKDYKNTLNVGICWAGNPGHPNDINRSVPLAFFNEIEKTNGVKLFSLQKDLSKRVYVNNPSIQIDLTSGCEHMKIVDMSEHMTDYKSTAALINSLDLIITVDTSILHLAGALGKKTWALIPFNPDWRWTIDGNKTVWYDSVKLFRQPVAGDWKSVFNVINQELNEYILSNKR